ncbi:hypothetical protein M3Y99_00452400 [Aphelenchoides fujianensis]|nr:hypothetical protein M3Y99_00452400 [Aphelenchoides fujianensis]
MPRVSKKQSGSRQGWTTRRARAAADQSSSNSATPSDESEPPARPEQGAEPMDTSDPASQVAESPPAVHEEAGTSSLAAENARLSALVADLRSGFADEREQLAGERDRLAARLQEAQDNASRWKDKCHGLEQDLKAARRDLRDAQQSARQSERRLQIELEKQARRSAPSTTRERKPFVELGSSQQSVRRSTLEKSIGAPFHIDLDGQEQRLSPADGSALRRIGNLSESTFKFCRRWSSLKWPSLSSVRNFERKRLDDLGDFTTERRGEVMATAASRPELMITAYIQHLADCNHMESPPNEIEVVVSADGGGRWTKLGIFVPTFGTNVQSPNSFLLLGIYEGDEKREHVVSAFAPIFSALNGLHRNGIRLRGHSPPIPIKLLFCADLKMTWIIFGVGYYSATKFCPWCEVSRGEHHDQPIAGSQLRDFRDNPPGKEPLLDIPPGQIVPPPLHMIQGAANTVFNKWDKDSREPLFNTARVPFKSYRQSSLLTGRDAQKFIDWLSKHPNVRVKNRNVLKALHEVAEFAIAQRVEFDSERSSQLVDAIQKFSDAWRQPGTSLPLTNKIHLFESHLLDFFETHGTWGTYSEQIIEHLHHVGNVIDKKCFGANKDRNAGIFMRQQLAVVFADHVKLEAKLPSVAQPFSPQSMDDEEAEDERNVGPLDEDEPIEEEDSFVNVWDDE